MRRWLRPLSVLLALLFLVEAWLWDHLAPVVARIVGFIPWATLMQWLARAVERLPPWATLIVFVVPLILLLVPLKFLEVYLLATRHWIGALAVIGVAKVVGVGVTAFIFDVTRDKLLQMDWFRGLYLWMLRARAWAHRMIDPVRARLRQLVLALRLEGGGRFRRSLARLRREAFRRAA